MGLALKVADAVVGYEEGAKCAIGVEGYEIIIAEVKLRPASVWAFGFQDELAGASIAELLGRLQVLVLGDVAEVPAVFRIMFFQQMLRAEPAPARHSEERGNQETGNKGKKPIVWQ